jgi:hypothetical protein
MRLQTRRDSGGGGSDGDGADGDDGAGGALAAVVQTGRQQSRRHSFGIAPGPPRDEKYTKCSVNCDLLM